MKKRLPRVCLVLGLVLLASCASTKVVEQWTDPSFVGKLKNILVLSLNDSDKSRQLFEDGFLNELKQRKIQSSVSYELIPSNGDINKEKVQAAIAGSDIDGVLVLRPVKVTKEQRDVRSDAANTRYDDFYAYVGTYRPNYDAYTVEDTIVHVEANLYAVEGAKLVWSGKTETFNPTDVETFLNDIVKAILDQISGARLI
jgi:hypothetical protein